MSIIRNIQVYSQALQVVIRNPTHKYVSCDSSPLLKFSVIGEDKISSDSDAVRVFVDNIEVSVTRVMEPYGYDFYGADDVLGTADDGKGADGIFGGLEEYGWDGYGADDTYGTADDGYGADAIPGTVDDGLGADSVPGTSFRRSHFGTGTDDGLGSDRLPGTLYIYQLPVISDGRHTVRVVIKSSSGLTCEDTEYFIVDTAGPQINITSPVNDALTPISEVPTLTYELIDSTGILSVNVNIDDLDYGWLPSGTLLDFLKSGIHRIVITAHDIALNECSEGNITVSDEVRFNLLRPIEFDRIPDWIYFGTDNTTKNKTVEAVIEELRVLNKRSTDQDVVEDFKLLRAKIRFQLREGKAVLSPDEVFLLQQMGISENRINLPDETLMLCHYDNNLNTLPGIGDLANPDSQIIDKFSAGRRVDIVVNYYEGSYIDRELIDNMINRVIPAFAEYSLIFNAVQK